MRQHKLHIRWGGGGRTRRRSDFALRRGRAFLKIRPKNKRQLNDTNLKRLPRLAGSYSSLLPCHCCCLGKRRNLVCQPRTILASAAFILLVSKQAAFSMLLHSKKKKQVQTTYITALFQAPSVLSLFPAGGNPGFSLFLDFCCCRSSRDMQYIDKVAEKYEICDVDWPFFKQTFKLCAECSL
jgi:hypothetical protein